MASRVPVTSPPRLCLPVSSPEAVSRRAEFLRVVKRALEGEAIPPTELVGDGRSLLATAQPLPDGGAVVVLLDRLIGLKTYAKL